MSSRSAPPPPILSKTEALDYATSLLELMARDMDLGAIIMDVFKGVPVEGDAGRKRDELKKASVEPKLQAAAMREAATAIRQLSIDERIVAARVAAGAGIKP